jgi:hypothetical protein
MRAAILADVKRTLRWSIALIIFICAIAVSFSTPASAQEQWRQIFDNGFGRGFADGIAVDSRRNVYVAGDTRDVDGNLQYQTLKYSPLGTLIWSRTFTTPFGPPTFT